MQIASISPEIVIDHKTEQARTPLGSAGLFFELLRMTICGNCDSV